MSAADRVAELERTVQQMCDALNGHDCPLPGEKPLETVTRVAVRLMEAERREAELEDVERRLLDLLPTEPLPAVMLGEGPAVRAEYGAWQQVAEVLGVSLPYVRPVDEDPIAYALTEQAEAVPHAFEREYMGESDAKRRLPNCKRCGRPASDPAHDEDVTPQVRKLRALLAGQRAATEDPHDSPLSHRYDLGRDLPEAGGAS